MRNIFFVLAGLTSALHAQTLDESLLQQATPRESTAWSWETGEPGVWNVWLDVDAGVVEFFEPNEANNDIRRAAVLGHPEWNSNTLTNVVNRMTNSGFDNAVYGVDNYLPRSVRIGVSRTVWQNLSAGLQVGRTTTPAYIECTRADGSTTVASWHQVRYADLIDQYLYLDDLYNGDQWRYQNNSVFTEGLTGWRLEFVAQQELAFGLGWMASVGTTMGLQQSLEARAVALSGGQGLLAPTEEAATLTPVSVAAAPHVASLGVTYRYGALVTGLGWSSVFLTGKDRNGWVAAGADAVESLRQARFRIGMTF